MRPFLLLTLVFATAASAQVAQPAAATAVAAPQSDWIHVQVLAKGTKLHIKTTNHGSLRCAVGAVDADSITCGGVLLKRESVLYVKSSHRVRSTLVGFGAGYGTAFLITLAETEHCKTLNCSVGVAAAVVLADVGLFIATPIIFGVYDLTAGTIYRAPGV